jgi:surface protein
MECTMECTMNRIVLNIFMHFYIFLWYKATHNNMSAFDDNFAYALVSSSERTLRITGVNPSKYHAGNLNWGAIPEIPALYTGPTLAYNGYGAFENAFSVVEIASGAFNGRTEFAEGPLVLPKSLVIIGANAFNGVKITGRLTIPASVTSIGANAFNGTLIDELVVENATTSDLLSGVVDATRVTNKETAARIATDSTLNTLKVPKADPTFTGTTTIPTAAISAATIATAAIHTANIATNVIGNATIDYCEPNVSEKNKNARFRVLTTAGNLLSAGGVNESVAPIEVVLTDGTYRTGAALVSELLARLNARNIAWVGGSAIVWSGTAFDANAGAIKLGYITPAPGSMTDPAIVIRTQFTSNGVSYNSSGVLGAVGATVGSTYEPGAFVLTYGNRAGINFPQAVNLGATPTLTVNGSAALDGSVAVSGEWGFNVNKPRYNAQALATESYTRSKIQLINGTSLLSTVKTLGDIASAIGADPQFAVTVQASQSAIIQSIASMASVRSTAVSSLSSSLSAQVSALQSVDLSLSGALSGTIPVRVSQAQSVSTLLQTTVSGLQSTDVVTSTAMSQATSARGSQTQSLNSAISTAASLLQNADTALSTSISAAVLTRSANVSANSATWSTHVSSFGTTDVSLAAAVVSASGARSSAIASLSSSIMVGTVPVLESADAAFSSALSEQTSRRVASVATLSGAISAQVSAAESINVAILPHITASASTDPDATTDTVFNLLSVNVNDSVTFVKSGGGALSIGNKVVISYSPTDYLKGTVTAVSGANVTITVTFKTTTAAETTIYTTTGSFGASVASSSGSHVVPISNPAFVAGSNFVVTSMTGALFSSTDTGTYTVSLLDASNATLATAPGEFFGTSQTPKTHSFISAFLAKGATNLKQQFSHSAGMSTQIIVNYSDYGAFTVLKGYAVPYSSGAVTLESNGALQSARISALAALSTSALRATNSLSAVIQTNQSNLTSNVSERSAAVASFASAASQSVSSLQSVTSQLGSALSVASSERSADISSLSSAVATSVSALSSTAAHISGALSAQVSNRSAAVLAAVTSLVGAAPSTLDTLFEIAAALDAGPALYSMMSATSTALAADVVARSTGVSSISASLSAVASTLHVADASLSVGLSAATADRIGRIASVSSGTSAFVSSVQSTQVVASAGISSAVSARVSGVTSVSASLASVASALQTTDSTVLSAGISAAASARASGMASSSVALSSAVASLQTTHSALSSGLSTASSVRQSETNSVSASLAGVVSAQQSSAAVLSSAYSALNGGINLSALADLTAVNSAIGQVIGVGTLSGLDTLNEIAVALNNNASLATTLNNDINGKANLSAVASLSNAVLLKASQTDLTQLVSTIETRATNSAVSQLQTAVSSMASTVNGSISSQVQSLQSNMTVSANVFQLLSDTIRQVDTLYVYNGFVNADGSINYRVNKLANMVLQSSSLTFAVDANYAVTKVTQVIAVRFDPTQVSVKYSSRGVEYTLNPISLVSGVHTLRIDSSSTADYANNATAVVITANETAVRAAPDNSPFTVAKLALSEYTYATPTVQTPYDATTWSDATGKISQVLRINFESGVYFLQVDGAVHIVWGTTQFVHTLEYLPGASGAVVVKALSSPAKLESAPLTLTNVYNDYPQHAVPLEVSGSKSITMSGSTYTYVGSYSSSTAGALERQIYDVGTGTYSAISEEGVPFGISVNYGFERIGQPLFRVRAKTGNGRRASAFVVVNGEPVVFSKPVLSSASYTTLNAGSSIYRVTATYTVNSTVSAVKVVNPYTGGTHISSQAASGGSVTFSIDYTAVQSSYNMISIAVIALANEYGLQSVASEVFVPIGQYAAPTVSNTAYSATRTAGSYTACSATLTCGVAAQVSAVRVLKPDLSAFHSDATVLPNAFYLKKGGSNWRDLIPLVQANTTDNNLYWQHDQGFYDVNYNSPDQVAMQFSYFAAYWLNANRASNGQSFSIGTYSTGTLFGATNIQPFMGMFTFTATSDYPVTTYTGSLSYAFSGLVGVTYILTPQTDGINAGIAASGGVKVSNVAATNGSASPVVTFVNTVAPVNLVVVAQGNANGHESAASAQQTLLAQFAAPTLSGSITYSGDTASMTYAVAPGVSHVQVRKASDNSVISSNNAFTNALNFDGVNDGVNFGVPEWTYSDKFRETMTIECWFKTTDTNNHTSIGWFISRNSTAGYASSSHFALGMTSNGQITAWFQSNTSFMAVDSTGTYKDMQWHHAAVTYQSSTGVANMYIDGNLIATKTQQLGLLSYNTTIRLILGSDDAGVFGYQTDRQFRGSLSEVRAWNVVRTPAEILYGHSRRLIGDETGLVFYCKLDQGVANGNNSGITTVTNNMAIGGSTGTLVNLALTGSTSNWVAGPPTLAFTPVNTINQTATISIALTDVNIVVVALANAVGRESAASAQQTLIAQFATPTLSGSITYSGNTASMTYTVASGVTAVQVRNASNSSVITTGVTASVSGTTATISIAVTETVNIVVVALANVVGRESAASATQSLLAQFAAPTLSGSITYSGDTASMTYAVAPGVSHVQVRKASDSSVIYSTNVSGSSASISFALTETVNIVVVALANAAGRESAASAQQTLLIQFAAPTLSGSITYSGNTASMTYVVASGVTAVQVRNASNSSVITTGVTTSVSGTTASISFALTETVSIVVVALANAVGRESSASAQQTLIAQFAAPTLSGSITYSGDTASMTYAVAPGVTQVSALKASDTTYSLVPSSVMGQTLSNFPTLGALKTWSFTISGSIGAANLVKASDATKKPFYIDFRSDRIVLSQFNTAWGPEQTIMTGLHDLPRPTTFTVSFDTNNFIIRYGSGQVAVYPNHQSITSIDDILDVPELYNVSYTGPVINRFNRWEMSIAFRSTGKNNAWRGLIGDMRNGVTGRGWGVWVSAANKIHFSWNNPYWDTALTVAQNTDYVLKITKTSTSLRMDLTDVVAGTTQTDTNASTASYIMSANGPVTLGGWPNDANENFVGTISHVSVVPALASAMASGSSATIAVPITGTESPLNVKVVALANAVGRESAASAQQTLIAQFAAPTLSGSITYSGDTASMTYAVASGVTAVQVRKASDGSVISSTNDFTNALNFDGVNDGVNFGVPEWTYSNKFRETMTIECWFKTTDTNNHTSIGWFISRNSTASYASSSHFALGMTSNGQITAWFQSNTSFMALDSTGTYKDMQWHHAAVTYQSSTGVANMYIDGSLIATKTQQLGLLSYNTTTRLILGSDDAGVFGYQTDRQFRGSLSEVRAWNVVRTPAEILYGYSRRLIGDETGLVFYCKLDQGVANGNNSGITTVTNNMAIGGSTGTLVNLALTGSTSNWVAGPPTLAFIPVNTSNQTATISIALTEPVSIVVVALANAVGRESAASAQQSLLAQFAAPTLSGSVTYSGNTASMTYTVASGVTAVQVRNASNSSVITTGVTASVSGTTATISIALTENVSIVVVALGNAAGRESAASATQSLLAQFAAPTLSGSITYSGNTASMTYAVAPGVSHVQVRKASDSSVIYSTNVSGSSASISLALTEPVSIVVVALANANGRESAASAQQSLLAQFAAPTLSGSITYSGNTASMTYAVASGVTTVQVRNASNSSVITTGVTASVSGTTASISIALTENVSIVVVALGNANGQESAASATQSLLAQFAAPTLSGSITYSGDTASMTYAVAPGVSHVQVRKASDSSVIYSTNVSGSSASISLALTEPVSIVVVALANAVGRESAASATQSLLLPIVIALDANGVTIKCIGNAAAVPTSEPRFIQADPRGTGTEWFAVVKQSESMKAAISSYASGTDGPFKPSSQLPAVPFNNIVTTLMTDMSSLFNSKAGFNAPIASWDTSNVTNMAYLFANTPTVGFNQPIGAWNTSKVINMEAMFFNSVSFNQPIGAWNTGAVTNMTGIFFNAVVFNQNISTWNTGAVTNMQYMFNNAVSFNQPIGTWNTGAVENMTGIFFNAVAFNQNISTWNTGAVTNMEYMFWRTAVFNQPIGAWNTGGVTNMNYMFYQAAAFNQNIRGWNVDAVVTKPPTDFSTGSGLTEQNSPVWFPIVLVGTTIKYVGNVPTSDTLFIQANPRGTGTEWFAVVKQGMKAAISSYASGTDGPFKPPGQSVAVEWKNIVTTLMTDMSSLFQSKSSFNAPIASWDTGAVMNMNQMFYLAAAFNQPIGAWNTGAVTNMFGMFAYASAFNQPIGAWNTGAVTDMNYMFYYASAFNQDITGWNVAAVVTKPPTDFSTGSALITQNSPFGVAFAAPTLSGSITYSGNTAFMTYTVASGVTAVQVRNASNSSVITTGVTASVSGTTATISIALTETVSIVVVAGNANGQESAASAQQTLLIQFAAPTLSGSITYSGNTASMTYVVASGVTAVQVRKASDSSVITTGVTASVSGTTASISIAVTENVSIVVVALANAVGRESAASAQQSLLAQFAAPTLSGSITYSGDTASMTYAVASGVTAVQVRKASDNSVISSNNAFTNALNFDGVNDGVNFGVPEWTYSDKFRETMTIECWFKTTDTNNHTSIGWFISRNITAGYASSSHFALGMTSNGQITAWLQSNTSFMTVDSTGTYKDMQWHHAAVTYQSSTGVANMYIDGSLIATKTQQLGLLSYNTTTRLILGSDDAGVFGYQTDRQFRGSLSEVRAWNVVRTPAEILYGYSRRLIGDETGLVFYCKLDQGVANGNNSGITTVTNNMAIGGSTGTLVNLALTGSTSNWVAGPPTLAFIPVNTSNQTATISIALTEPVSIVVVALANANGRESAASAQQTLIAQFAAPTLSGSITYSGNTASMTYTVASGVTAVQVRNASNSSVITTGVTASVSGTTASISIALTENVSIVVVALANAAGQESAASATQTLLIQFAAPTLSGSITYSGNTASMTYAVASGVTAVQVRNASNSSVITTGVTASVSGTTASISIALTETVSIVVVALANANGRESAASAQQSLLAQFAAPTLSGSITYSGDTASMTYAVAPGVTQVSALKASDTTYSLVPSSVMGQTLTNFPTLGALKTWTFTISGSIGAANLVKASDATKKPFYIDFRSDRIVLSQFNTAWGPEQTIMTGLHDLPRPTTFTVSFDTNNFIIRYGSGQVAVYPNHQSITSIDDILDVPELYNVSYTGPVINRFNRWEMSIAFRSTGKNNAWRALIGEFKNGPIVRGWGVWVSAANKIHFSWNNPYWDTVLTVAQNTDYVLKITKTSTSLMMDLTDVVAGTTQTDTNASTASYIMSAIGPVTLGGWINDASENFVGTISHVSVVPALASAMASGGSATIVVPTTDQESSLNVKVVALTNAVGRESAASATQNLVTTVSAPALSSITYSGNTANMTYTVDTGVTAVQVRKESDNSVITSGVTTSVNGTNASISIALTANISIVVVSIFSNGRESAASFAQSLIIEYPAPVLSGNPIYTINGNFYTYTITYTVASGVTSLQVSEWIEDYGIWRLFTSPTVVVQGTVATVAISYDSYLPRGISVIALANSNGRQSPRSNWNETLYHNTPDNVGTIPNDFTYNDKFGGLGTSNESFNRPMGIAQMSFSHSYWTENGYANYDHRAMLIADTNNHRVQIFALAYQNTPQLTHKSMIGVTGQSGNSQNELNFPKQIAVSRLIWRGSFTNHAIHFAVADSGNHRIQVFEVNYTFANSTYIRTIGSFGSTNGKFNNPCGVAYNQTFDIIVADTNNSRIQKFNSDGEHLQTWGVYGTNSGQLNYPESVATNRFNHIIVGCSNGVQIFDTNGAFITKLSGISSRSMVVTDGSMFMSGKIVVLNYDNNTVHLFSSVGNFIFVYGSTGSGDGQFNQPSAAMVDSSGRIYVCDRQNHRIQILGPQSQVVERFNPTINVSGITNSSVSRLSDPFNLDDLVSSNSGGAFTYSVPNNSVISISGSFATVTGTGPVVITLNQAAHGIYNSFTTTATLTVHGMTFANTSISTKAPAMILSPPLHQGTSIEKHRKYGTVAIESTISNVFPTSVKVSTDGQWIVVGNPFDNGANTYKNGARGRSRVYKYISNQWIQVFEFLAAVENVQHGSTVAIAGNGRCYAASETSNYSQYIRLFRSSGIGATNFVNTYVYNQYSANASLYRLYDTIHSNCMTFNGNGSIIAFGIAHQNYYDTSASIGTVLTYHATPEYTNAPAVYGYKYGTNGFQSSGGQWDYVVLPANSANKIEGTNYMSFGSSVNLSSDGFRLAVSALSHVAVYTRSTNTSNWIAGLTITVSGWTTQFQTGMMMSANGTHLAVATSSNGNNIVTVYNATSGAVKFSRTSSNNMFGQCVGLSGDGVVLVISERIGNYDHYIRLWNIESESIIGSSQSLNAGSLNNQILSLSVDGSVIAYSVPFLGTGNDGPFVIYHAPLMKYISYTSNDSRYTATSSRSYSNSFILRENLNLDANSTTTVGFIATTNGHSGVTSETTTGTVSFNV